MTLFPESPEDPFSVAGAGSAVLDYQGRVVGWSRRAEMLLGHRAADVLGRSALETLVHPGDRGRAARAAAVCLRTPGWFGLLPVLHRDGHRMHLGLRARLVTRAGAGPEWFLVGAPAQDVIQWETDRSVLDNLFRRSPVGLAVHAPDLRILRVNRALARIGGLTPDQARGHRMADFLLPEDARTAEDRLREVLATGRPTIFTEQSCRLRIDPARARFVSVSAFRLEDSTGHILGVTQLVEDVTERHRARLRLDLLSEAGTRIGTTLDVATTARELTHVLVPDLADCATVDLLDPVSRGEEPSQDGFGPVRRTALACDVPHATDALNPLGALIHFAPHTPQGRCLADQT
ncbi:protein phosphatase, partial [Streptomyces albireticuli]